MAQDSAYTDRMKLSLRASTTADLETHVAHRLALFRDLEAGSEEGLRRMADTFRVQLRNWLVAGQCRGFLMEDDGRPVAGVLMLMRETLPTPVTPLSVRGYLFNIYTEPSHRRQGLAARLTDAALDLARDIGLEVMELHASLEAEGLYQRMGFVPTSEMRLVMGAGIKTPKLWKNRR
ncbi:GNAT family N-acetyltransferase [Geothrix fuzhouensis]|uniref:GNAT family N-acetyltransferase n=1 Tax=Geothrix fuzhouensis TaxID=2966451 RepID=UPI002148FCFB|nr:GNAT family N-acetyltransferase [Geothrix fuzhouensis]